MSQASRSVAKSRGVSMRQPKDVGKNLHDCFSSAAYCSSCHVSPTMAKSSMSSLSSSTSKWSSTQHPFAHRLPLFGPSPFGSLRRFGCHPQSALSSCGLSFCVQKPFASFRGAAATTSLPSASCYSNSLQRHQSCRDIPSLPPLSWCHCFKEASRRVERKAGLCVRSFTSATSSFSIPHNCIPFYGGGRVVETPFSSSSSEAAGKPGAAFELQHPPPSPTCNANTEPYRTSSPLFPNGLLDSPLGPQTLPITHELLQRYSRAPSSGNDAAKDSAEFVVREASPALLKAYRRQQVKPRSSYADAANCDGSGPSAGVSPSSCLSRHDSSASCSTDDDLRPSVSYLHSWVELELPFGSRATLHHTSENAASRPHTTSQTLKEAFTRYLHRPVSSSQPPSQQPLHRATGSSPSGSSLPIKDLVRWGRVIEVLDSLAGDVTLRHLTRHSAGQEDSHHDSTASADTKKAGNRLPGLVVVTRAMDSLVLYESGSAQESFSALGGGGGDSNRRQEVIGERKELLSGGNDAEERDAKRSGGRSLDVDSDWLVRMYVTGVGKKSVEVRAEIWQANAIAVTAYFVMVVLPSTPGTLSPGKSLGAQLPLLSVDPRLDPPEFIKLAEAFRDRMAGRKEVYTLLYRDETQRVVAERAGSASSVGRERLSPVGVAGDRAAEDTQPRSPATPNNAERRSLRKLEMTLENGALTTAAAKETETLRVRLATEMDSLMGVKRSADVGPAVPIASTVISSHELMQFDHRNVFGKMFGGYLARKALELAWVGAQLFAARRRHNSWAPYHLQQLKGDEVLDVKLKGVDSIHFIAPVEVGCVLALEAAVVLSLGGEINVQVTSYKIVPSTGDLRRSNVFHFHFLKYIQGQHWKVAEAAEVYPETPEERQIYDQAKRRCAYRKLRDSCAIHSSAERPEREIL